MIKNPKTLAFLMVMAAMAAPAAGTARGQTVSPQSDERVLMTFAVFGDNKGGSPILDATFASMKRIAPSFVLGMGDHFKTMDQLGSFDEAITRAWGKKEDFYRRFYLTAGDNEAQAYSGFQFRRGTERPFFFHAGLFRKSPLQPLRPTIRDFNAKWLDYYAVLDAGGARIHLVNLYDQDSVAMPKETRSFARDACAKLAQRPKGEAAVVISHDGPWWRKNFPKGHDVYSADLLLGASLHRYTCYGTVGGGPAAGFNTSAVARGDRSWYAVLVTPTRVVVFNIDDRRFVIRGVPGVHVKPIGAPGIFDGEVAPWFAILEKYGKKHGTWGPEPTAPAPPRPEKKTPQAPREEEF